MNCSETNVHITEAQARNARRSAHHVLAFFGISWLFVAAMVALAPQALFVLAYFLPGILLVGVLLVGSLIRAGISSLPLIPFFCGAVLIVGGGLFDMSMTALHCPDLSTEQNVVARSFLETGHSVAFVYAYAIVAQSLYLGFLALMWTAFLRHRALIIASARNRLRRRDGGAARLGFRYHFLWFVAVFFIAGSVDRWYLGFEWLGLVSEMRSSVMGIGLALGLAAYTAWLVLAPPPRPTEVMNAPVSAEASPRHVAAVEGLLD